MASPSTIISLGYGSFGSVNLVPTLGYGSGVAVDPYNHSLILGSITGTASDRTFSGSSDATLSGADDATLGGGTG